MWHCDRSYSGLRLSTRPIHGQLCAYSGTINNQESQTLLETGCEANLVTETAARICDVPAHSLAVSPRLQFADGEQNAMIGEL